MANIRTTTMSGYPTSAASYPTTSAARVIQAPGAYSGATVATSGYTSGATVATSGYTAGTSTIRTTGTTGIVQGARTVTAGSPVTTTGLPMTTSLAGGVRQARIISGGTAGVTTMAQPTYISGQRTVLQGATAPRIIQGARPATIISSQQNTVGGPDVTQAAYEVKHKDDPQLQNLKELRKTCGLKNVPVNDALQALKSMSTDGKLTREQFLAAYTLLLQQFEVEVPEDAVKNAVFDLFDRDDNGVVDMMELICGASLLCTGTEEDKIHAVFNVFDENGDGVISMDEMFKFLTSVFKVVLTPNVMAVMNSMGVTVESAEDLASVTALECFKTADLNHDGRLSVTEFKNWFFAPRNDPSFLFSPVRKLLQ
jgi:Ca2+-binding EF-hand superfamily protein